MFSSNSYMNQMSVTLATACKSQTLHAASRTLVDWYHCLLRMTNPPHEPCRNMV